MVYIGHLTHFSHKNIVKATSSWADKERSCRDFPSVEDHDTYLIDQINKYVKPNDVLWHLGDFALGSNLKENLPKLRKRINCKTIYLTLGNHDHLIRKSVGKIFPSDEERSIKDCFAWTGDSKIITIAGRTMIIGHYAMLTFPWQTNGTICCHGHSHNTLRYPDEMKFSKILDVGVDVDLFGHEKFTPWPVDEIFHVMDTYKTNLSGLDHHTIER